jgi:Ca2+-transporting ATPase
MLLLQLLFTYAPFMNSAMASAPITLHAWWRILGVSIITYLIIEFEKWVRQRLPISMRGRGLAVSPKA